MPNPYFGHRSYMPLLRPKVCEEGPERGQGRSLHCAQGRQERDQAQCPGERRRRATR